MPSLTHADDSPSSAKARAVVGVNFWSSRLRFLEEKLPAPAAVVQNSTTMDQWALRDVQKLFLLRRLERAVVQRACRGDIAAAFRAMRRVSRVAGNSTHVNSGAPALAQAHAGLTAAVVRHTGVYATFGKVKHEHAGSCMDDAVVVAAARVISWANDRAHASGRTDKPAGAAGPEELQAWIETLAGPGRFDSVTVAFRTADSEDHVLQLRHWVLGFALCIASFSLARRKLPSLATTAAFVCLFAIAEGYA